MKNMQIAGTGNSRFLKSALTAATTWEEARSMLIAGTFPIDFNGLNDAGVVEKGTPYDVSSVLKDATTYLYGKDPTAVPDDIFALIPGLLGEKLRMDLRWENASPTSSFAAQAVSVDMSDGDMVAIEFDSSESTLGGQNIILGDFSTKKSITTILILVR